MILCDVNVLLHAMVEQSPHQSICRRELESLRSGGQTVALSSLILAALALEHGCDRVARSM